MTQCQRKPRQDPSSDGVNQRGSTRSKHAPQLLVQCQSPDIILPHEEVDEPAVLAVGDIFKQLRELLRVALVARLGGDGEGGDVRVPGQVVHVGVGLWVVGLLARLLSAARGLAFANDFSLRHQ